MKITSTHQMPDDVSFKSASGVISNTQDDNFSEKIVEHKPDRVDEETVPDSKPGSESASPTGTG